jgi:hypothetical protein
MAAGVASAIESLATLVWRRLSAAQMLPGGSVAARQVRSCSMESARRISQRFSSVNGENNNPEESNEGFV